MEDTTVCPICGNKLRNVRLANKYINTINKTGTFFERTCTGINHSLQFFTDESSKKIDMLRFSLDPKYTKYLEIDYVNKRCRIYCMKNGEVHYIHIPKMVEPDFPDLVRLKERISIYVVFS